jgi:hypothetical protein
MANGGYNTVKAGSTVPLKFKVYGLGTSRTTLRTDTGVVKSFQVTPISCEVATEDSVDFLTTGGTSLRFDSTLGGFVQNWKTPTKRSSCYRTSVTLIDGTTLGALFKIK